MSNCIKDFFDYDLVKKCCRCKTFLLKSSFHKHKAKRDGYACECASCCKKFYLKNSNKVIQKQKDYTLKNRDQTNEYHKNMKKKTETR